MSVTRPRPVVPEELPKVLHDLSYAVIKNNPQDIISFAADYFQKLLDEREKQKETTDAGEEASDTSKGTEESAEVEENSPRNIV